MRTLGRNRNTHDTATVTSYTLNSSTATVISVANHERIGFHVQSDYSDKACYIRFYPSSQDNTKHGIRLHEKEKGRDFYEMPPDNVYTGEISAIADEGSPRIMVTEW